MRKPLREIWEPGVAASNLSLMLAAEIWHWWIGVALTGVGVLASLSLIGGYMKSVSSKQHPGGKRRRQNDL